MECRPIKAVQSLEVMIPEPINIDDRCIPIVASISFSRLPEFRFLAKAKLHGRGMQTELHGAIGTMIKSHHVLRKKTIFLLGCVTNFLCEKKM